MKKPLFRDQIGKRCRLNRAIKTGVAAYPKGTEFTITSTHQGRYYLTNDDGGAIRRVFPVWIDIIDEAKP